MSTKKAATVRRFAEGTDVDADKSRHELEALLGKHGAAEFALFRDTGRSVVMYRIGGRMVRHTVSYPAAADYEHDRTKPYYHHLYQRTAEQVKRLQEQEWRRRWRALLLIVKAKLELIASGESSVDREFMADVLLPNGQTVAEALLPKLAASYENGDMPPMLLGAGLLLGEGS